MEKSPERIEAEAAIVRKGRERRERKRQRLEAAAAAIHIRPTRLSKPRKKYTKGERIPRYMVNVNGELRCGVFRQFLADLVFIPHEDDLHPVLLRGQNGSFHDHPGRKIASHRIDGNLHHTVSAFIPSDGPPRASPRLQGAVPFSVRAHGAPIRGHNGGLTHDRDRGPLLRRSKIIFPLPL